MIVFVLIAALLAADVLDESSQIEDEIRELISNAKSVIERYSLNNQTALRHLTRSPSHLSAAIQACTDDEEIRHKLLHLRDELDKWRTLPTCLVGIRDRLSHGAHSGVRIERLRGEIKRAERKAAQIQDPVILAKSPVFVQEMRRIVDEAEIAYWRRRQRN